MGLRLRKSIKVAPGVKVNLNKKSAGVTFGGKGMHYSVNTSGKRTSSVGIPGTGVSYVSTSGGGSNRSQSGRSASSQSRNNGMPPLSQKPKKWYQQTGWIIALLILFFPVGLYLMWKYTNWSTVAKSIISGIIGLLAIFSLANPSPTLESITISSTVSGQLEVNQDYVIDIVGSPTDASITGLEYQSYNQDIATFEKKLGSDNQAVLHTISPGTVTICVTKSNIASNTLTFEIIDPSAVQEPVEQEVVTPEPTEEPLPEAMSEPTTETVRAIDVVNIRSQDNTDSDILGKCAIGDTFTRYEAMDNGWSRIDYNGTEAYMKSEYLELDTGEPIEQTSENTDTSGTTEAVADPAPVQNAQPQQSGIAYITNTGKKYHLDPTCGNMDSAIEISLEDAMKNYEPCSKCAQ